MVQIFGILVVEIIIGVLCVCLTLIWSARIMSDALARLTASVAAIGADVAGIADAIRNHINGDSGISQDALNALADQLDDAGAKLKGLETGLEPASDTPASDVPAASDTPASDVPAASDTPASDVPAASDTPASDVPPDLAVSPSDLPPDGNQNGVGSEFAGGEAAAPPADALSEPPADALSEPPADALSEPPADGGLGEPAAPPTDNGSPIE